MLVLKVSTVEASEVDLEDQVFNNDKQEWKLEEYFPKIQFKFRLFHLLDNLNWTFLKLQSWQQHHLENQVMLATEINIRYWD